MISLIVSYKDKANMDALRQNISETIGMPCEIIGIHNPGREGLCSAYNRGAMQATHEILCFVHDDVLFLTQNWGSKLADILPSKFDLVGVAGSEYKSFLPTGWATGLSRFDHHQIYIQRPWGRELYSSAPQRQGNEVKHACVLDGVFMACRKEVWQTIGFNENIEGFHCYDIDFSIRASLQYKVGVCFDIEMVHYSAGKFETQWVDQTIKYHREYRSLIKELQTRNKWPASMQWDKAIARFWIDRLKVEDVKSLVRLKFIFSTFKVLGVTDIIGECWGMGKSSIRQLRRRLMPSVQ